MLNSSPSGGQEKREDLPIFAIGGSFNLSAGTYYLAHGKLVPDIADAAVFDNSGDRWLARFKLYAGAAIPASKALSVVPIFSIDDGATFSPVPTLEIALSGAKRAEVNLNPNSLVKLPDKAVVVYQVTLSKTLRACLNAILYLY